MNDDTRTRLMALSDAARLLAEDAAALARGDYPEVPLASRWALLLGSYLTSNAEGLPDRIPNGLDRLTKTRLVENLRLVRETADDAIGIVRVGTPVQTTRHVADVVVRAGALVFSFPAVPRGR